jgi:hypothetical protein
VLSASGFYMSASTKNRASDKTPRPNTLPWAGAKIGVTLPTIYALIRAKKLRSFKIRRAHRVDDQALRDCINLLEEEHAATLSARVATNNLT